MKKTVRMIPNQFFNSHILKLTSKKPADNFKNEFDFDPLIITKYQSPFINKPSRRKKRHKVLVIQQVKELKIDSPTSSQSKAHSFNNDKKDKINACARKERAKTRINCSMDYKRSPLHLSSRNKDIVNVKSALNTLKNPQTTKRALKGHLTSLSKYSAQVEQGHRLRNYLKELFDKSQCESSNGGGYHKKARTLTEKVNSEAKVNKVITLTFDALGTLRNSIEAPMSCITNTTKNKERGIKMLRLKGNQRTVLEKHRKVYMNEIPFRILNTIST